jgi:hypothetical protein
MHMPLTGNVCAYVAGPRLLALAAGPRTGQVTTEPTGSTCSGRCLRCCRATSGACRWLGQTFAASPSNPVRSCVRGGSALARFTRSAAHTRRMGGLAMRCTGELAADGGGWERSLQLPIDHAAPYRWQNRSRTVCNAYAFGTGLQLQESLAVHP